MALVKCKECGSEVSDKAQSCPKCGAPIIVSIPTKKKTSMLTWTVGGVIALIFYGAISGHNSTTSSSISEPQQAQEQLAKIEADNKKSNENIDNAIQASHFLKKSLRDPDSLQYDHVIATENGTICYEYRAKNGFGGVNRGKAFYLPKEDKFRMSEMDSFGKTWKRECAGKSGENIAL